MTGKIIDLFKEGSIVFPKLLLTNYRKLNLTELEVIFVIYLINNSEFDPKRIASDLDMEVFKVLELIDSLTKKDIIKLESVSNNKKIEEYFCLDELYNKLALIFMSSKKEEGKNSSIYDEFEKEFGRTLSPKEYEIIGAWLDDGFMEETIDLALREAIFNGVTSLRYVDRILFDWKKKGIKNKADLEKNNNEFRKNNAKKEVFDYDWLNE